ncbi:uncharacterized protein MEPE_06005 [Melanopsichium pennsylvanicum]|uniref:F-box domain-containing protein n=2 Tax=Melanopsichium pennsylvanicum TaxID=63383 RepID=A0AAJ4XRQ4_9BASI|nr:wd40 repeat-like protein [Melanopsichium pennsylvanicum 4]SNX87295.1 uncharacterized protein MEPE_06005 [Melanopsichium pennsylvanicum]
MTSITPATRANPVEIEIQEILQSPQPNTRPLIADDDVSSGSYRRSSLPSSTESFRNVTSVSPLSSPDEEKDTGESIGQRGGRRQMLRSGTSGSITPLSASSVAAERNGSGIASGSRVTLDICATAAYNHQQDPTTGSLDTPSDATIGKVPTSRPSNLHPRHPDLLSSSTAHVESGLLSVFSTPAAVDDLFRSPSVMSASSDADGYFTARPGSPVDSNDLLSLSALRSQSAKSRSALCRQRVSQSGRSYATASSEDDLTAATNALSIDDEACYVDGDHLSPAEKNKHGLKRIDFFTYLPPELSLCIVHLLSDHTDLLSASLVSKQWRVLAMSQSVWRHLFFSRSGWAIREDAPLVLAHQAELSRMEAKAKRTAAKEEAERVRKLQEARMSTSTSTSPYMDRLAALKSWRETLHIPSFPHLSLTHHHSSNNHGEVDVDCIRSTGPAMSPLRSPTAATGRFGLFLSPARKNGAPSTPAGARRAQEAAASCYFDGSSTGMSRQASVASSRGSGRGSVDSTIAALNGEMVDEEEFFAASLDWVKLYRDRWVLEQRWMRDYEPRRPVDATRIELARTVSAASATRDVSVHTPGTPGETRLVREKRQFEPSKRFLRGHQDSVYCIRQDDGVGTGTAGKLVSGSRDRTIRVWDVETGACHHILKGHSASVLSLQYDEEILVSVSSDGQVFVWDFQAILATSKPSLAGTEGQSASPTVDSQSGALIHEKGERVHCVLRDHTSAVLDVVFDSNWIVTGSKDATVRVWRRSDISAPSSASDPAPPSPRLVAWRKFSHTGPVNAVDLQGNQVVSASGEGSMYLWDLDSGEKLHTFTGHSKGLACIVFKGDTLVSGSNDQTIRIWNTKSGKCTHVLREHHMLVRTVAFDQVRGLVVSGGYDRLVKIWHISTQYPFCTSAQQQQQQQLEARQHSEEDDRNVEDAEHQQQRGETEAGDEAEKPAQGKCLRDLRCHRARIFDVDFNTTRIFSASEDHLICITDFGGQGIDTCLFA